MYQSVKDFKRITLKVQKTMAVMTDHQTMCREQKLWKSIFFWGANATSCYIRFLHTVEHKNILNIPSIYFCYIRGICVKEYSIVNILRILRICSFLFRSGPTTWSSQLRRSSILSTAIAWNLWNCTIDTIILGQLVTSTMHGIGNILRMHLKYY